MDNSGAGNRVVIAKNVVKKYRNNVVLKDVCLEALRGDRIVIVGPNGSGKTTLIKILLGLTPRDHGVVKIFGIDPMSKEFDKIRRNIGYLPEKVTLMHGMRVEEYLSYISLIKGCHSYDDVMELLGLIKYRNHRIKALSQGYKRRVLLAAALLCSPRLLMLDEPYANIDLDTRLIIDELLNNIPRDTTILMTTHIEPSLNSYTAVFMMDGKIIGRITVEDTIYLILTCDDERIELSEKELKKVNELIRHGCDLKEITIINLMKQFRKMIYSKEKDHISGS